MDLRSLSVHFSKWTPTREFAQKLPRCSSPPAQQMYIGRDKCKFDCAPANELDFRAEFTRQNTNQEQLVWIFTASCGFYTCEFPAEEKLKAYWLCGTRANTRHADAEQNFTATVR
jgi:hypothetical protein